MKLSELHRSNMLVIALLITSAILAIIAGVGYAANPQLFSSFSWIVFLVVVAIAIYMLVNIKKIFDELKRSKNYNNSKD
jgi:uncharacterized membrane protein YbhN (UPF0104 family)